MTLDNLPGISFDGCQIIAARHWLCFTELTTGASFSLPPHECAPENIIAAASQKRRDFQRREF